MLGFSEKEVPDHLSAWSERLHPEDRDLVMEAIQAHLDGESEYYISEHRLRCKDGSYKWILDRGKASFDDGHRPSRMTVFQTDITERKRLEEKLGAMSRIPGIELEVSLSNESKLTHTNQELVQKLQAALERYLDQENILLHQTRQAAMGEMVSILAHQWRQPITAIGLGVDNILMDMMLSEHLDMHELKENLHLIRDQVNYLSQTIDDFRDFFLPDRDREEVMLRDCIEAALNVIETNLLHHGIQIEKTYGDTNPFLLYKNEMVQVILNILKNADDVLLERNVSNAVIRLQTVEHEDTIEVSICDNAGGIPAEIIHRIYEPYFTTKNEHNGTGIGLYMSKTIIEEHCCGKLQAKNVDNGACFTIILPKFCDFPSR